MMAKYPAFCRRWALSDNTKTKTTQGTPAWPSVPLSAGVSGGRKI